MMSVKSPMIMSPATNGLVSTFPAFSTLPASPRPPSNSVRNTVMSTRDEDPHYLAAPSPNTSNHSGSNETFIDPSPVASSSNGTEFTDLEEIPEQQNRADNHMESEPSIRPDNRPITRILPPHMAALRSHNRLSLPELSIPASTPPRQTPLRPKSDEDEAPQSVIHAPAGFSDFVSARPRQASKSGSSPSPSLRSDTTVKSPARDEFDDGAQPPPTLDTRVKAPKDWTERGTPRAQTRSEVDFDTKPGSSLEGIPEGTSDDSAAVESGSDVEKEAKTVGKFKDSHDEIAALQAALAECWTLCNTLASLSSIHRERIFNFSGKGDLQEQAWESCWKLCQKLYDSRDDASYSDVRPTLDLCREFCQALFETRSIENEAADSVLRVSFELNNHLYNTHDRNLPEAFRERTLDFYITLCHRLMKQSARQLDETDSLLRTCWSLAEMLFSIRQSKRENKAADEELLGSAVQACWELCDLFREGWTQIRPDRGTPRPSHATFSQAFQQARHYGYMEDGEKEAPGPGHPETPTTIFEDTANTPDEYEPTPNIFQTRQQQQQQSVSRPHSTTRRPAPLAHNKWSSTTLSSNSTSTSTLSGASSSSTAIPTSATSTSSLVSTPYPRNTTPTPTSLHPSPPASSDPNLQLLKSLILLAAQNAGFVRSGPLTLPHFARSMPVDSFGHQPWQTGLLENYRRAVAADERAFRDLGPPVRVGLGEAARAVEGMMRGGGGGWKWLGELFRLVFGVRIEEATGMGMGVAGRRGQQT